MSEIRPIETRYKGYRFRSRLEARWAVFFDRLGIEWLYEPEGFALPSGFQYLPDFFLPKICDRYGRAGIWVEIKGTAPTQREDDLCRELCESAVCSVVMLVGPPEIDPDMASGDWGYQWNAWEPDLSEQEVPRASWDNCMSLHYCEDCGRGDAAKFEFRNDYYRCPVCKGDRCTYDNWMIRFAAEEARSARFEHGETPR